MALAALPKVGGQSVAGFLVLAFVTTHKYDDEVCSVR